MVESHELKKAGLKVTLPRMKILDILANADERHLSAEGVYHLLHAQGEDIGLATVYRVLTQFESAGLVKRHNFEGGSAVFELDDDDHHDHIVCNQCGKITEFLDEQIEERQRAVAAAHGFEIKDHSLILHADCVKPNCANRSDK